MLLQVKSDGDWSECGTIRSRRRSLSTSRLPRRQSRAPSVSPSRPSPPSTPSSSKTVLCNTTPKALSSASSGYNSLPRSHKSKGKLPPSGPNTPKSSQRHISKNSIKVEVSSSPTIEVVSDRKIDTRMTASINDPSATMTTTINGPNSTKIYVQQQNSPMRSVITLEKGRKLGSTVNEKPSPKEELDRSVKTDLKRTRRPTSVYQQKDAVVKDTVDKNEVTNGHMENNLKMKFPSSETIQMEEKLLITGNKNNKNLCQKKNVFDPSNLALKSGSLIDVADFSSKDERMNNIRKASFPFTPIQSTQSSDKVLESLSYKNILNETLRDNSVKKDSNSFTFISPNKINPPIAKGSEVPEKKTETDVCPFPSLNDLSLHFTSIAAQNILKGVSINSIDTLVEVNMAAEKHKNKDVTIHSDLGIV